MNRHRRLHHKDHVINVIASCPFFVSIRQWMQQIVPIYPLREVISHTPFGQNLQSSPVQLQVFWIIKPPAYA